MATAGATIVMVGMARCMSADGVRRHCLDSCPVDRAIFGIRLGVVNTPGHRPGTDHRRRAHPGSDDRGGIGNKNSAGFRDCDALFDVLGHSHSLRLMVARTVRFDARPSLTMA